MFSREKLFWPLFSHIQPKTIPKFPQVLCIFLIRGPFHKFYKIMLQGQAQKSFPISICSLVSDTHQKISKFPTLVAAHQADVSGPPVGRGPQVENRCARVIKIWLIGHSFRWYFLIVTVIIGKMDGMQATWRCRIGWWQMAMEETQKQEE